MLLTRYGLREWLGITVVCAAAAGVCAWAGWWWAVGMIVVVWLGAISFFRDPIRRLPRDLSAGDMLSPADGAVTAVERVDHHEATGGPAVILRIFLSLLNVHINRSPCDGEVVAMRHTPGRFLNAMTPESAKVNESNLITLRLENGETIGVRQVAGLLARRIVCPLKTGDRLARGQKFGMIKFGSTTELILPRPDDVTVRVRIGDKVKAGLTALATIAVRDSIPVSRDVSVPVS